MCKQEEDFSNIVARVDSPGGGSLIKGVEMLVWIKPLKEINLGVAQPFFDP